MANLPPAFYDTIGEISLLIRRNIPLYNGCRQISLYIMGVGKFCFSTNAINIVGVGVGFAQWKILKNRSQIHIQTAQSNHTMNTKNFTWFAKAYINGRELPLILVIPVLLLVSLGVTHYKKSEFSRRNFFVAKKGISSLMRRVKLSMHALFSSLILLAANTFFTNSSFFNSSLQQLRRLVANKF